MEVSQKSIGAMIDELCTASQHCFQAQDTVCRETDAQLVSAAAKRAQSMNRRRNELIRAIDLSLGQGILSPTPKNY